MAEDINTLAWKVIDNIDQLGEKVLKRLAQVSRDERAVRWKVEERMQKLKETNKVDGL